MEVVQVDEAFLADTGVLVGKAIKYDQWEHRDFNHFNQFLTWLDGNFEYELKAADQSLNFFIIQRLK